MATGGYRGSGPTSTTTSSSSTTTDFLEEWKAKREKMRAKQGDGKGMGTPAAPEPSSGGSLNCLPAAPRGVSKEAAVPVAGRGAGGASPVEGSPEPEREKGASKGKGCPGPSARKGKGQIEKRKLREKRRSTGVVSIPAGQCLDEYDDDEAGQKERKREDALTQQNTMQNESASTDPSDSCILQETSRTVSNRYKSTTNTSDDDVSSRYTRAADRTGYNRYNREANSSGNIISNNSLEKKIEELEKELAKERQENLRLVRIAQDKEELIGKMKEEIDLLNRDLDDIEDENEQLKQENKTLLKVVGQLTR